MFKGFNTYLAWELNDEWVMVMQPIESGLALWPMLSSNRRCSGRRYPLDCKGFPALARLRSVSSENRV